MADEVAADALLLEPAPDGRSRLGGPPLLPAGEPWPVCDDGLPHTFLAAIALADLPSSALPGEGWLLFFAALSSDGTDGLLEEAPNAPGSAARLYLTADAVPGRPLREPPGGTLGERRVRAAPRLSLPDDSEAAQRLGLDVFEADAYEELRERLMYPEEPHHWIGGHASGTQGDAPAEGTTLLLHLDWDEALGFEYLDAATIQFRIPDAALAAGDFTQAYALVESG